MPSVASSLSMSVKKYDCIIVVAWSKQQKHQCHLFSPCTRMLHLRPHPRAPFSQLGSEQAFLSPLTAAIVPPVPVTDSHLERQLHPPVTPSLSRWPSFRLPDERFHGCASMDHGSQIRLKRIYNF
jgi:hypothetical protein